MLYWKPHPFSLNFKFESIIKVTWCIQIAFVSATYILLNFNVRYLRDDNNLLLSSLILSLSPACVDLGVGLKIMGGVKCDRCNNLHAVITSIFTSNENLHADLKEGNVLSMLCPLMVLYSFRCKTTSSSVVNNGLTGNQPMAISCPVNR